MILFPGSCAARATTKLERAVRRISLRGPPHAADPPVRSRHGHSRRAGGGSRGRDSPQTSPSGARSCWDLARRGTDGRSSHRRTWNRRPQEGTRRQAVGDGASRSRRGPPGPDRGRASAPLTAATGMPDTPPRPGGAGSRHPRQPRAASPGGRAAREDPSCGARQKQVPAGRRAASRLGSQAGDRGRGLREVMKKLGTARETGESYRPPGVALRHRGSTESS